jgi:hypothetical protein
MNNERYKQIIDEVYENYKTIHKQAIRTEGDRSQLAIESLEKQLIYSKEEFINKCKTDTEFSEKWGLKIEERELSLEERCRYAQSNHYEVSLNIKIHTGVDEDHTLHKQLDVIKIPTKLINIKYKEEKIKVYE